MFRETPLGEFLARNAPTEYELIQQARTDKYHVTADLVESIVRQSNNPVFQSAEFREALGDYRKYKCRTPNVGKINLDWECDMIRKRLSI